MNIAILPARGGSKRIPRKNIKYFHGKPMIAYAIQAAVESKLFNRIIVSTDDAEIAEIASENGAEVPFLRSSKNASDTATTMDVLKEVLAQLNLENISSICCIYPCVPLLKVELLTNAFQLFTTKKFDTLLPVIRFNTPIQRALTVQDGKVSFLNPSNISQRTQDLEPTFHDAGMFYWTKPNIIQTEKALFTNNTGFIEITELEAQDIDNELDWQLAEFKYAYLQSFKK